MGVAAAPLDALATAATPVVALAYEYLKSEVAQALLVYACGPLYFVFLFLEALKHSVRRLVMACSCGRGCLGCCKGVSSAEGKFCLTPVAIESLSAIKSWDWSQVLLLAPPHDHHATHNSSADPAIPIQVLLWLCYISLGAWFGLIFTTPTYMCLSALRTALALRELRG